MCTGKLLEEFFQAQGSGAIGEAHLSHLLPGALAHGSDGIGRAIEAGVVVHHRDTVPARAHVGLEVGEAEVHRPTERREGILRGLTCPSTVRVGTEVGLHPSIVAPWPRTTIVTDSGHGPSGPPAEELR